jgi:hypothetical protein
MVLFKLCNILCARHGAGEGWIDTSKMSGDIMGIAMCSKCAPAPDLNAGDSRIAELEAQLQGAIAAAERQHAGMVEMQRRLESNFERERSGHITTKLRLTEAEQRVAVLKALLDAAMKWTLAYGSTEQDDVAMQKAATDAKAKVDELEDIPF